MNSDVWHTGLVFVFLLDNSADVHVVGTSFADSHDGVETSQKAVLSVLL